MDAEQRERLSILNNHFNQRGASSSEGDLPNDGAGPSNSPFFHPGPGPGGSNPPYTPPDSGSRPSDPPHRPARPRPQPPSSGSSDFCSSRTDAPAGTGTQRPSRSYPSPPPPSYSSMPPSPGTNDEDNFTPKASQDRPPLSSLPVTTKRTSGRPRLNPSSTSPKPTEMRIWRGLRDLPALKLNPNIQQILMRYSVLPITEFLKCSPIYDVPPVLDISTDQVLAQHALVLDRQTSSRRLEHLRWLFQALAVGDIIKAKYLNLDAPTLIRSWNKRMQDAAGPFPNKKAEKSFTNTSKAADNLRAFIDRFSTGSLFWLAEDLTAS